ncbi:H+transporting two-sector ATPase B/B' subunit [Arcobacter nitrofigilis DSM 7299]|uniref:ATP synthase subunit b n=1 Tax=Arcobacter nitrofigilis (strain ATCC 33309 / DSM 7299 / CCUG 15893 / LMG 7604 / NCTC 12251 / CI) TaxID=572480 RepID=D5V135_ARCNC|nr:F0F1 ATP synthase subunit B [Arcobacter nitrofigilis]ADG93997.1 H+transporting two-sector ATPase B/B' subunit [Arcobacter nitrofigilis DSM 7299]
MNKLLLTLLALAPVALFANSDGAETDIIQRTVNFVIFAGILWYLLADKIKAFFANRTLEIQSELDKVQDTLKASQSKIDEAAVKLDEAKKLAAETVELAKSEVGALKQKVADAVDNDIAQLNRNFAEKIEVETKKVQRQVVEEILEELLKSENIALSQDELASIILKKVA